MDSRIIGGADENLLPFVTISSILSCFIWHWKGQRFMFEKLAIWVAALVVVLSTSSLASAQQCPRTPPNGAFLASQSRGLEGRVIYHDGIRQWFELRLDRPQCKQTSIQLVETSDGPGYLAAVRGCHVMSYGQIDTSGTGYFSLDLYQVVSSIKADRSCIRKPAFADHSHDLPNPHVRSYTVEMHVNYTRGDHPILFDVRSGKTRLSPWQAYASYDLTGGYVLYGHCGQGFVINRVFGTPAAHPNHFDDAKSPDDTAAYDPEAAAQAGVKNLNLGYSCIRTP
jgi:hypothetical protein